MLNYLFIGNSVYALFLYCLRFYEQIEETLFLLGPSCTFAEVNHCLPICTPRDISYLPLAQAVIQQQTYLLLNGQKVPCYGNVETVFSDFFTQNFTFYPISDGLRDTVTYPEYLKQKRFKKCYTIQLKGGLDIIHPNLEYINISKLWNQLNKSQQIKIMHIFQVKPEEINILKERTQLLLTQPLSEDMICSDEEKKEIYKRILQSYDEQKTVIKAHPRETTDWKTIFPNAYIIPKHLPAEILSLLVPNMEKVITFFSTAAFNMLSENQIDFYGKDFKKLKYYTQNWRIDGNKRYKSISSFDIEETYKNYQFNWLRIPDEDGRFYLKQI
ncbi:MAG: hypothetical protein IJC11_03240 [Alphaproteobacteria bacterium]|mgnify:CR=1 FL=1|nr:hypothetical protein [Alphaproteobacteria bacterium]MBQ3117320.1 hypothetical protein [Alphaproteobacteria bacterium]MBR3912773.1 hypothetical protein [Alphaproteobacteria bacterium]